jgi:drug/metabolite transporter (DMT)-like permease
MSSNFPAPKNSANGYAIAGFVLSLICCAPLGITFSAVALSQIRQKPDQEGKGMAIAGLAIGIASLAIGLLLFLLSIMTPFWAEFWEGFWIAFEEELYGDSSWY